MLRRDPGSSQVLNNIIIQTQLATPLGAELEAQANPSLCSAAGTLSAAESHVGAIAGCWDLQTQPPAEDPNGSPESERACPTLLPQSCIHVVWKT